MRDHIADQVRRSRLHGRAEARRSGDKRAGYGVAARRPGHAHSYRLLSGRHVIGDVRGLDRDVVGARRTAIACVIVRQ